MTELLRNDSISLGQGSELEAGQGDLNGVLSHVDRISIASSGEVDLPERDRTFELLIDRAF